MAALGMRHPLRLYGHRGAPLEAPENTMPAFRRALDLGVDALELDVHLTRDGHPVVSHDATAHRMAGVAVAWKKLDLADARRLDVGHGFVAADGSRPFAGKGVRIPTLEELLVELPGVTLNIDLKQTWPSMVERAVAVVRRLRAEDRVVFASFHLHTILAVRARGYRGGTGLTSPEVLALWALPRGFVARVLFRGTLAQIPERVGRISLDRPGFIDKCHDLGLRVDYFTIDDPATAARLLDLGADGIMTNDPRAVAPVLPRGARPAIANAPWASACSSRR